MTLLTPTLSASELFAVNQILGSLGQAPVTSIDQTNPEVSSVYDTLMRVSRETQAEGWVFNTEHCYPVAIPNGGEVLIPDTMLSIDLSSVYQNNGIAVTQRNGKLYNKTDHTFIWDTIYSPLSCDVVWMLEFNDLPQVFKDYITAKACAQCCVNLLGDTEQFKMLRDRETTARGMLMNYECTVGDFSMFGYNESGMRHQPFQAFRALQR